jgi:hypothetical protein
MEKGQEEILEVFADEAHAKAKVHVYARKVTRMGITRTHGVYTRPVIKTQYKGAWAVLLKRRS